MLIIGQNPVRLCSSYLCQFQEECSFHPSVSCSVVFENIPVNKLLFALCLDSPLFNSLMRITDVIKITEMNNLPACEKEDGFNNSIHAYTALEQRIRLLLW